MGGVASTSSALEQQCYQYLMQGLAPSTRRTYSSAQKKFIEFCNQLGNLTKFGSPCPAEEWTLCLFASFLAKSLKHSSIKVYLSAVRSLHIEMGFADPLANSLRLQRVVRGIKRVQGLSVTPRLPVTKDIMLVIYRSLDFQVFDHIMFWAACTLAYFGFLRSSEFTTPNSSAFSSAVHVTLQDVAFDSHKDPSCVRVFIKASKTDPFRKGCYIHIGQGREPLCAIAALSKYLQCRGDVHGPLFVRRGGAPLSRALLTDWLRGIVTSAGLDGNYSSHSFRIGAATMAGKNGVPDHIIQSLGRWTSNAYQMYIRTAPEVLAKFTRHLS